MKEVAVVSKCQECQLNEVFVHFGEETLCLECYNGRMEKQFGVAATSYPEGVAIRDGLGEVHHFQLRKRLDPIGIFMEAEELNLVDITLSCREIYTVTKGGCF